MKKLVLYTAFAVLLCAALLLAFETVRLKAEIASRDKEQAVFMEKLGFFRAKAVSQRRLNKIVDSRQNTVDSIKETGLHVAAVEKASAKLETRVQGSGFRYQVSGIGEQKKEKVLTPDTYSLIPEVIGTAEITDYELLATKPPVRKMGFGVQAGVEMALNGEINGAFAGPDIYIGRINIGCQVNVSDFQSASGGDSATANMKSLSLLVSAGWRW